MLLYFERVKIKKYVNRGNIIYHFSCILFYVVIFFEHIVNRCCKITGNIMLFVKFNFTFPSRQLFCTSICGFFEKYKGYTCTDNIKDRIN